MVDRLDLKTGDKLTEAAFATVDANFAELDRDKANATDIPTVPDISGKADRSAVTDLSGRVDTLADTVDGKPDHSDIPDIPDVSGFVTQTDIDNAVSGLASESSVSELASRLDALEASSGSGDTE